MPVAAPSSEKAALRAEARARRRVLAADPVESAECLADRAVARATDLGLVAPAVVAGYWPMGDEIDPRPLLVRLHADGLRCVLPALAEAGAPLRFRAWAPGDVVVGGPHRTLQPDAARPALRPDVVLVPLLAFDGDGVRLGWGGGYYDRGLTALRAAAPVVAVGLGFEGQRFDRVPREPHDAPLDWVVTERSVRRTTMARPAGAS